jgi:hypothetical protein
MVTFNTSFSYRNESRSAQVIAWSLAVVTAVLILVLVAFVGILLAGISHISRGVTDGGGAVSQIIPEVARVRNEAVEAAREVMVVEYDDLLQDFYEKVRYVCFFSGWRGKVKVGRVER